MYSNKASTTETTYGLKVNSPFDLTSFENVELEGRGLIELGKPGIYTIKCLDDIEIVHNLSSGLYHITCVSGKDNTKIKISSKGINSNSSSDIYHHVINSNKNTEVEINCRGLCDGGKIIYRSNIESTKDSSGFGKQSGKFLILSPSSEIDAIPELDNMGKEMSVSHSISIGKLNQNHLKYLNMHGFNDVEARQQLIEAFLN
jgi:hypothetical protein